LDAKKIRGLARQNPAESCKIRNPRATKSRLLPRKQNRKGVPPILRPMVTGAIEVRRDVKTVLGKE
jgi:hypothetical protein